ncbi:hypothetical protein HQ576_17275, partial [bacterium]|nr:hypothetical protein [bacterium]
MTAKLNPHWPVLRHYDQDHLARIALPLGGIGTGTVSLGGRGNLRDWEVVNRPAKGFGPSNTFFALWAKPAGGQAVTRCLEGILPPEAYEGSHGAAAPNHGLPRFRRCSFAAAYPFGQVALGDPDVPLDVRLEAFNPLVPADPDASSLPVAVLRFVLRNKTARTVRAAVCGSLQNFVGTDGSGGEAKKNLNTIQSSRSPGLSGVLLATKGVDPADERWGSLALATTATAGVTCRTAWADLSWGDALLDFWDDFSDDGKLERRSLGGVQAPMASVAARTTVPARGTRTLTFFLAWHFPNRMTWSPVECSDDACGGDNPNRVGNHYATLYADAWDAADHAARVVPELEKQTLRFVRAFADADLPPAVKEAALFNLSTLRSQTCFRTEDGRLYGWEGCSDRAGCCQGSCTHVWNYEQATAFLFGSLARSMREVEFAAATHEDGGMNFRVALPLDRETRLSLAAADGQMGCLLKLYRDWQLSGDDGFLKALWPYARRALEFCWIPGGWDADQDGVMEGCQH